MNRTGRHAPPKAALVTCTLVACTLWGGTLLALGAAGPARTAAADDDAPEAEGIEWIDGWAAGRARAEKDGKLLFVYFGRHSPS